MCVCVCVCCERLFSLQVEEHTPFARRYSPGEAPLPSDASAAAMYHMASHVLRGAGGLARPTGVGGGAPGCVWGGGACEGGGRSRAAAAACSE